MGEVDECEADALLCLEIDWQVEVIKLSCEIFVDDVEHVLLAEFVWYVFYHQSGLELDLLGKGNDLGVGLDDPLDVDSVALWSLVLLLPLLRAGVVIPFTTTLDEVKFHIDGLLLSKVSPILV